MTAHLEHISLINDNLRAGILFCQCCWPHNREWRPAFADDIFTL
jgi:hypothetical protein